MNFYCSAAYTAVTLAANGAPTVSLTCAASSEKYSGGRQCKLSSPDMISSQRYCKSSEDSFLIRIEKSSALVE